MIQLMQCPKSGKSMIIEIRKWLSKCGGRRREKFIGKGLEETSWGDRIALHTPCFGCRFHRCIELSKF